MAKPEGQESLESPVAAPVINGGATMVMVPEPARFAQHKLFVSVDRSIAMQTKAAKDRRQACKLIDVLLLDRPGDSEIAMESLNRRGQGWRRKLRDGLTRLPDTLADAKKKIAGMLRN